MMKKLLLIFCLGISTVYHASAQKNKIRTFTNPLLPSGADPWVIYKDGYYYYTNSTGSGLDIWKTKNITRLSTAEHKTVWRPPIGAACSRDLWAPELHFLNNKWYIYFAADDGDNSHHRIYVVENSSKDPLKGMWIFRGQVGDSSNKWAIDASVFENRGQLYMIWAGWEGDTNGEQNIYIAKMQNPVTIVGDRVKISTPTYQWEKYGDLHDALNPPHVNVNEGPEILMHGDKIFLIYSASGCWTDYYALGMLTANSADDLLNPMSWKKSTQPVFKQSAANGVYATGHNSFFKSPDGKEDWILYHANPMPGMGCGKDRSPRAQKFMWKPDGSPDFGIPLKTGIPIPQPSGSK